MALKTCRNYEPAARGRPSSTSTAFFRLKGSAGARDLCFGPEGSLRQETTRTPMRFLLALLITVAEAPSFAEKEPNPICVIP